MKTCVCLTDRNIHRSEENASKNEAFKETAFQEHIIFFSDSKNESLCCLKQEMINCSVV